VSFNQQAMRHERTGKQLYFSGYPAMNKIRESHYRQVEGLEVHEADDGLIIFNSRTDKVHHLNHTAGVLYELCLHAQTRANLVENLQSLYQLEYAPLEECEQTLNKLLIEGVLEEVNDA
jgi:hypothetical protein